MLLNLIRTIFNSFLSSKKRVEETTPAPAIILVSPNNTSSLAEPIDADPPDLNHAGIALIKSFESCKLSSYRDIVGRWTIGWGTTGDDITSGLTWTQAQADERFTEDLTRFSKYVDDIAATKFKLNDNQFSALTSFCYNCGPGNLKKLVEGSDTVDSLGNRILLYDKGRIGGELVPIKGLTRRRQAERDLFNKGIL